MADGTTVVLDPDARYRASDPLVIEFPELFVAVYEVTSAGPDELR